MKRRTLQLLLLTLLSSSGAMAQVNCSSGPTTPKLVCEFPISTGVLTNASALGSTSGASSGAATALQAATTLNIAVATQVSQLPMASASSGTLVVHDKNGAAHTINDLGPILTDRAQTIGKNRFFLGATASQFVFTDIDGNSLGNLKFAFYRTAYNPATGAVLTNTYTSDTTRIDFRINQFIGVATWGLTDTLDLSVIVPVERVSIGAYTGAPTPATKTTSYVLDANNKFLFQYDTSPTYAFGSASGVGDITVNGKSIMWKGERAAVSAAMNFRLPTGDKLNLLGSGAFGLNPYLAYSYQAKVSPHAKVGYQWNTRTVLNNPTLTFGGNKALPGGMQYDIGVDYAIKKQLTIAGDLLGNQYLNTPRLNTTTVKITDTISVPTSTPGTSSYWISNVSTGLKWNPVGNLVLSGNVLFQLIDNGLRSRPTPLVGIAYRF